MDWMAFLTLIVVFFALVLLVAGIFTAGFGSGKSRTVGIILLVIGLVIGVIWVYLTGYSDIEVFADVPLLDTVRDAVINLIAVLIGALAAVGLFLVAVMKS
jgi:hypothetical protein